MKKYNEESTFVNMFSKDCKKELKNGQKFEAEFNGIVIVITNMDNNNSSKVTMYQGTINGVAFNGNITALKKRLNIAFTKEYNRTTASAKSAKTVITIKTDQELSETAKTANERIMQAVATLRKYSDKYQLGMSEAFVGIDSVEGLILQALCREREAAKKALKEKETREAAAKEAAAKEAERKEATKRRLLDDLAAASANGDMAEVMRLSKALKQYM